MTRKQYEQRKSELLDALDEAVRMGDVLRSEHIGDKLDALESRLCALWDTGHCGRKPRTGTWITCAHCYGEHHKCPDYA